MRKKLLTLLLSIAVILTSTVTVFAASFFDIDGIKYEITTGNNVKVAGTTMYFMGGDVTIPSTVKYEEVTYTVTSIGEEAFKECTIVNSIVIPNTVTSIDDYAFMQCSNLTNVTLPSGLLSIGQYAFNLCTKLTDITIPSSVTSIGNLAFYQCTSMSSVVCNAATPASLGTDAFNQCTALTSIKVPAASVDAYKTAAGWSSYEGKIEAIPVPVTIADILPNGFPTSFANGWLNSNGFRVYIDNENLIFAMTADDLSHPFSTSTPLTLNNNNYELKEEATNIKITFEMKEGVLKSIILENSSDPTHPGVGTYTVPVSIAKVLDTLKGNFPTTFANGWRNDNGYRVYADSSYLNFANPDGQVGTPISTELSLALNGNNYEFGFGQERIIFEMEEGVLKSIILENSSNPTPPGAGTYSAITPEPSTYTVTYNANGATSGTVPNNQTKTAGVDLTLASRGDLEKTGYILIGWNTQANGKGTHYEIGATYKTDADLDLYAEWIVEGTKKVYQILPEDFPISGESSTWTNKSGTIALFKDNYNFYYREKEPQTDDSLLSLMQNATPCDEGYQCSNISDTLTFTFHMNGEKLISIEITGNSPLAGVYAPIPEVKQLYEVLQLSENPFPTSGESSTWTNKFGTFTLHKDNSNLYYYEEKTKNSIAILALTQSVTACDGGYQCLNYPGNLTFTFHINGGILTSIDIAGNDPLVGTYSPIPATITIADILNTVDGGFPTSSAGAWSNTANDSKSYIMNGNLFVYGKTNVELSKSVTKKDDGNYEYIGTSGTLITFVMESGKLTQINVSNSVYPENNGTYVAPHVHTFTYTANDNVITATCTDGCTKGYDTDPLTLTLTAPSDLVYDGNEKLVTFAANEAAAWTGVDLELPTITYTAKSGSSLTDNKAVNAGSYTASITVDTDKTASLDFEITKATPYIKTNPAPNEIDLGQKLSDSTLAGGNVQVSSTDSTQVAGLFEWKNPDTVPALEDSDTTLYDVTFTPIDTNNYNTVTCQVTITVKNTASPVTIAEILATVDGGFPTYGNAWKGPSNMHVAYISGTSLLIQQSIAPTATINVNNDVLKVSDSQYKHHDSTYNYDVLFNLNNNKLVSIEFTGISDPYSVLNGTYSVPITVAFNMNGHGTQIPNQVIPMGTKVTKPTDPVDSEDGRIFGGWYRSASCEGDPFDFDTSITKVLIGDGSTITLYAKWKQPTIADVLATVEGGFPVTRNYGWINENGKRLYTNNNNNLMVNNVTSLIDINSSILTLTAANTYTYEDNPVKWTFNMNNGVLKRVVVSDYDDDKDGTYVPATFISEVSFKYEDFDFSNLSFAPAKAPDGAQYEVIGSELILLKDGNVVYRYYENNWHDEEGEVATPKLADIDQAAANVVIQTSGTNTFDSLTVEVTADNKDGSSKVLKKLQDVSGAKNGEGFMCNDQTLICCLLFDAPVISEVNINYTEFDFLKFNMECPTIPTEVDCDVYDFFLLKNSEPVARLAGTSSSWTDLSGDNPVDPSKIEFDAGSIYMRLVVKDGYLFNSNPTVKANEKTIDHLDDELFEDFLGILDGKKEGYIVDDGEDGLYKKIHLCLMFKRYEIIKGNELTINVDNNKDALFVSNADYDKFYKPDEGIIGKVLVDDELVDPSNYTHASGSTEVTLKASYLSTLSNGKHTLTIVSSDGEASTTFTITRNPKPSPNPGYIVPNTGVN